MNKQVEITKQLIKLLESREEKGIATYGGTLKTHNGRSSPQDVLEELIDGAQYCLQWIIERKDYINEILMHRKRDQRVFNLLLSLERSVVLPDNKAGKRVHPCCYKSTHSDNCPMGNMIKELNESSKYILPNGVNNNES